MLRSIQNSSNYHYSLHHTFFRQQNMLVLVSSNKIVDFFHHVYIIQAPSYLTAADVGYKSMVYWTMLRKANIWMSNRTVILHWIDQKVNRVYHINKLLTTQRKLPINEDIRHVSWKISFFPYSVRPLRFFQGFVSVDVEQTVGFWQKLWSHL